MISESDRESHELATANFATPEALWALVPLILLWQLRLWRKSVHAEMTDDPIIFAAKDRVTWGIGLIAACAMLLAKGAGSGAF